MVPAVYKVYTELLAPLALPPDAHILEVGACRSKDTLILHTKFENTNRVGINADLDECGVFRNVPIMACNANKLSINDHQFDVVLCNSVLEHDLHYARTIVEMDRVLKPGGWLLVGAPSFSSRIELPDRAEASTITMAVHDCPCDYYRFSPQFFRDLVMKDYDHVQIRDILNPPRIIAIGQKK
jgi:ubiquinone/menaquinone biosynthesis C-methylase UbiE